MNRILLCIVFLGCLCRQSLGQDFDSDFRICNGMPRSQVAFAMALAGDLQGAAINVLQSNGINEAKQKEILQKLFHPIPSSLLQLDGRVDLTYNLLPAAAANQIRMQFNQAVASKLSAAQADNIVCSISLLSYREASDVFGRRVANQYGVVQVTIRNTDADHEFLLHQVDFWFGDTLQYYASHDKKIARGVAEKGQIVDLRNGAVRILEGIGSVAGPITNVFSNDAKLASSIYNSSFVPAVKSVFPDLTVQQVAKLDDMGFSAGGSTMVIAKNGAISLVAFIPSDSFLVPKLSQYEAHLEGSSSDSMKDQLSKCAQFTRDLRMNSVDMTQSSNQATASSCDALEADARAPVVGRLSADSLSAAKGRSKTRRMRTMGLVSSSKNLGDFDPAVVLLLQRDLHIMISGSHIQQLSTQLAVTSVSCSMPDPLLSSSSVTCSLGGSNLNLLTTGRLIDKLDSTVFVDSNGLQTSKDDPTHAQVTFPGCPLANAKKLSDTYLVELSVSTGAPRLNPSEQSFKTPTVPSLTCTRGANVQCTLTDFNLPTGATLSLIDKDGKSHSLGAGPFTAPAAEIPKGSYSASIHTSDDKTIQFCSPVAVP